MDNIIYTIEQWNAYTKMLDTDRSYRHGHRGEPERYPCKIAESEWNDDPDGPYYYEHRFIYQCQHCGQWP